MIGIQNNGCVFEAPVFVVLAQKLVQISVQVARSFVAIVAVFDIVHDRDAIFIPRFVRVNEFVDEIERFLVSLNRSDAEVVFVREVRAADSLPQAELIRAQIMMSCLVAHASQSIRERADLRPIFDMVGHVALFVQVVPNEWVRLVHESAVRVGFECARELVF
jgi:hypothetical protein